MTYQNCIIKNCKKRLERLVFIYTALPGKTSTAEQESPHFFGLCAPEINTTEVYCLAKRDHSSLPQFWPLCFKLHRIQSPFHSYNWNLSVSSPENRARPPAFPVNQYFNKQNQRGVHITTKKFNINRINWVIASYFWQWRVKWVKGKFPANCLQQIQWSVVCSCFNRGFVRSLVSATTVLCLPQSLWEGWSSPSSLSKEFWCTTHVNLPLFYAPVTEQKSKITTIISEADIKQKRWGRSNQKGKESWSEINFLL